MTTCAIARCKQPATANLDRPEHSLRPPFVIEGEETIRFPICTRHAKMAAAWQPPLPPPVSIGFQTVIADGTKGMRRGE